MLDWIYFILKILLVLFILSNTLIPLLVICFVFKGKTKMIERAKEMRAKGVKILDGFDEGILGSGKLFYKAYWKMMTDEYLKYQQISYVLEQEFSDGAQFIDGAKCPIYGLGFFGTMSYYVCDPAVVQELMTTKNQMHDKD